MLEQEHPGIIDRKIIDGALWKLLKGSSLFLTESHKGYKRTLQDKNYPEAEVIIGYRFTDHPSGIFEKVEKKTIHRANKLKDKNDKKPMYHYIHKVLVSEYNNPVYAIYDKKSHTIAFRRLSELPPAYWELYHTKTNTRRFQCSLSPSSISSSSFYDLNTGKLPTTLIPHNHATDIVTLFRSYIYESRNK